MHSTSGRPTSGRHISKNENKEKTIDQNQLQGKVKIYDIYEVTECFDGVNNPQDGGHNTASVSEMSELRQIDT